MPDESANADEPIGRPSTVGRRPLLKALGFAAATSLGSGVAAADDSDDGPEIDPLYGFTVPDVDDVPGSMDPDHEVELHTADPTPGKHGALFHFEPTGLAVDPGDVVQFTATSPDHTVTAYHPAMGFQHRVPEAARPFSSPVLGLDAAWLYRFDEPGLYDVYCAPHHILGMVMRLVVGDLDEEDVPAYEDTFEGSEEPPLLAPFSTEFLETELRHFSPEGVNEDVQWVWLTPQEVLDAPALDPANVQRDDGRVTFDEVLADVDRVSGGHAHE
ncbi:plastocyanin/azurin family copper-binding protein [Halomicrobium salinisoli]|uniref:plastocyanin/azurin family copper-binding protein n=1 Tax=Halomicrobium salinisoli TaxID=2878391 RepID=UPI001CF07DFA|nr:plastocyanin/azurin family copper-binding protein [Halomicrobium salinisoli]